MTHEHSRLLHQDKDGCIHARKHGFKLHVNIYLQWENSSVKPVYADKQVCRKCT